MGNSKHRRAKIITTNKSNNKINLLSRDWLILRHEVLLFVLRLSRPCVSCSGTNDEAGGGADEEGKIPTVLLLDLLLVES
jgi:hypothetical protein